MFRQLLQQAREHGHAAARGRHVAPVAQQAAGRRPGEHHHHGVAPQEMLELGGLGGRSFEVGVGAVHVDQQVPVATAPQQLIDMGDERLCIRPGRLCPVFQHGDLASGLQRDLRTLTLHDAGGHGPQRLPGLGPVADLQRGDPEAHLVALYSRVVARIRRPHRQPVGGVEDLDGRVLAHVRRGLEQPGIAAGEQGRRRHQPHRRAAAAQQPQCRQQQGDAEHHQRRTMAR